RPGALTKWQLGANFKAAKSPLLQTFGAQARRSVWQCFGTRAFTFRRIRASEVFALGHNSQHAVLHKGVNRAIGIALLLVVAAAPTVGLPTPFAGVDGCAFKFIAPHQFPAIARAR